MNFFKNTLVILLAGLFIQSAIPMEDTAAPHLAFEVIDLNSREGHEGRLWGLSPTVTGVVGRDGRLALGKTYIRHDTLEATLKANGLEELIDPLADYAKHENKNEDDPKKDWQVIYMIREIRGESKSQWLVDGIAFIQGPWSMTRRVKIPYIVIGDERNVHSCIEHIEAVMK